VTKILRLLGVIENDATGFPLAASGGGEDVLKPFLDTFRDFRSEVRGIMRGNKDSKEAATMVLNECDKVRDEALPKLGVRLEDMSDGTTRWKLDDPAVLMREIEGKKAAAEAAQLEKKAKEVERAVKKLSDVRAASVPPSELFKGSEEYGTFGEDGIPLTLKSGEEVNKSQSKKLKKVRDFYFITCLYIFFYNITRNFSFLLVQFIYIYMSALYIYICSNKRNKRKIMRSFWLRLQQLTWTAQASSTSTLRR
jgi:cysteinyl-tRNA synthetase